MTFCFVVLHGPKLGLSKLGQAPPKLGTMGTWYHGRKVNREVGIATVQKFVFLVF